MQYCLGQRDGHPHCDPFNSKDTNSWFLKNISNEKTNGSNNLNDHNLNISRNL